jgi:tRNA threonylcarbamoyl adenosine modification protein YeaZ
VVVTPASTVELRSTLFLALDTATDRPTLALGTPAAPGADVAASHRHDLSRDIDRLARELLAARGSSVRQLGGIVVADGPGSFTGLRIGIAFAKGLCRVLGVPLLTAPSLLGAARAAAANGGLVLAEYDALRGDVYRALYRFGPAGVEIIIPPALCRADASAPAGAARAGGSDASAAALLSLVGIGGGPVPVLEPAIWEPDYGRPAEAEARRLARHADR